MSAFATANPFGVASVGMPIPYDPGLAGVTFFVQGGALTGSGPLQGIDVTAARRLVTGN